MSRAVAHPDPHAWPELSDVRPKYLLALWAGKLAMAFSRRLGRGGSSLPGRVARWIEPRILDELARRPYLGSMTVSGTNGKTTTAKLLAGIAARAGRRVIHNRAGANMIDGVTAAFLEAATWDGRPRGEMAILEVDEASVPGVFAAVRPRVALVTNFFRDQLDRYGELDHTVGLIRQGLEGLAAGGRAVLCADDPLCAGLAEGLVPGVEQPVAAGTAAAGIAAAAEAAGPPSTVLFYGLEDAGAGGAAAHAADARRCVRCGHPYEYEHVYYAHLGRYRCPACGHRRPRPQVYAENLRDADLTGTTFDLVTPGGVRTCRVQAPGLYNVYNAVAAAAAGFALGVDLDAIAGGISGTPAAFGRMERLEAEGREVLVALVKNPAGYNQVLRTVLEGAGRKNLLLLLNDLAADGTDVSWIWDVDFEILAGRDGDLNLVICSGRRAEDQAVRMKYAGVSPARIVVEGDPSRALEQGLRLTRPGEVLYVLPTYTAMLALRSVLQQRGYLRGAWDI